MIARLIGIILFFVMLTLGIGPKNLQYFIDPSSAMFVFGSTFPLLLFSHGTRGCKAFYHCLMNQNSDDAQVAADFANAGATYSILSGFIASIVNLKLMMQNITDPAAIGPGLAVAGIATLYGLLLAVKEPELSRR